MTDDEAQAIVAVAEHVGPSYEARFAGARQIDARARLAWDRLVQAARTRVDAPARRDLPYLPRDDRQRLVTAWARQAFGEVEATNLPQRGIRLLEEAIEAYQACGGGAAAAHKLVAYVFDRPPGEIGQELGGVAVTVLALAAAAGLSADEEECREINRVLDKPVAEFTQHNADKNAAGFRLVTFADEVLAELEKRLPDAVPVEISQDLIDRLCSDEEDQ